MPPSLGDRLAHLLEAIDEIERALHQRSLQDFTSDLMLRMAVERLFEIISEASRYIPDGLKAGTDEISWKAMADLGNWLRHAYHRIDPEILWNIAKKDLSASQAFR